MCQLVPQQERGAGDDGRPHQDPGQTVGGLTQLTVDLPGQVERAVQPEQERSEEHTSELQSRGHLVCCLVLEKKKNKSLYHAHCRIREVKLVVRVDLLSNEF